MDVACGQVVGSLGPLVLSVKSDPPTSFGHGGLTQRFLSPKKRSETYIPVKRKHFGLQQPRCSIDGFELIRVRVLWSATLNPQTSTLNPKP